MEDIFLIDSFIIDTMNFITFLRGKKTYIVAVCIGIVAVCQYLGYITKEVADILYGLLAGTGVITARAAIAKATK
jgi:hypothetical protein